MAEGLLRELAGDHFDAYSVGLDPTVVDPLAIQAMSLRDIDIRGQRAKGIVEYLGHVHFGYPIPVCDRANRDCPTFPGVSTRPHWPFADPAAAEGDEETRLGAYCAVRDQIEARLVDWLAGQGGATR